MICKQKNTVEEFREWLGKPPALTQNEKDSVERFAKNFIQVLNRIDISKNEDGVIVKKLKGEI